MSPSYHEYSRRFHSSTSIAPYNRRAIKKFTFAWPKALDKFFLLSICNYVYELVLFFFQVLIRVRWFFFNETAFSRFSLANEFAHEMNPDADIARLAYRSSLSFFFLTSNRLIVLELDYLLEIFDNFFPMKTLQAMSDSKFSLKLIFRGHDLV